MAVHNQLIGRAARIAWRLFKPRTIGVRAVLLDQHDRIALVRHTYDDFWYLPGGGVKKWESAEAALVRELQEEIAVTAPTVERVVGVYHSRAEGKDDHIVIFVAHTVSVGDELRRADVAEIAEARWFAPDQLPASASPATRRRIADHRRGGGVFGPW